MPILRLAPIQSLLLHHLLRVLGSLDLSTSIALVPKRLHMYRIYSLDRIGAVALGLLRVLVLELTLHGIGLTVVPVILTLLAPLR